MADPSTADAPASTADPAPQSTATSEAAPGGEEGINQGRILVIVGVLLVVAIVGIVVVTTLLGGEDPDEEGGETAGKGKGNSSNASPATPATPRPGMLVCVVGIHLSSSDPLQGGLCDYIIYPELTILNQKVVATHGGTSWGIFKAAMEGSGTGTKAGGSFLDSETPPEASGVRLISEDTSPVDEIVQKPSNFRALGFLGIKFAVNALDPLKSPLRAFYNILKKTANGMTFLGVVVSSGSHADVLAKELKDITYINTVILQTHITPSWSDAKDGACKVHYVGYRLGEKVNGVPSYSIAQKTWTAIKKQGNEFRVMFSSTFGVVIYTNADEIKSYNDPCEYAFLGTVDALCPETGQGKDLENDNKELASYVTWEKNNRHHFMTTMDEDKMTTVLASFIENVSEGWAGFNIELDERNVCKVDEPLALLKKMSKIARTRKKP